MMQNGIHDKNTKKEDNENKNQKNGQQMKNISQKKKERDEMTHFPPGHPPSVCQSSEYKLTRLEKDEIGQ